MFLNEEQICETKRGRALSPFFAVPLPTPPQEAKNQKLLYNIIFGLFYQMNDPSVLFHIDLTLTVAMVTEYGRQNRLK